MFGVWSLGVGAFRPEQHTDGRFRPMHQKNTWRRNCFVHGDRASFQMTRTLQYNGRSARTSLTKAVQQYCRGQMRPVVAHWSKFIDAGCLA
jgi:hypothetical protein